MSEIKCPKCNFQFNAEESLKDRVNGISSFLRYFSRKRAEPIFKKRDDLDEISEAVLTICPNCKNEFPFTEYKFFGFISAKSLNVLFVLFFLGILLFSIGIIINDLTK